MIVLHALNILKLPLDILHTSFIMVFTHTFIITRGSIKLFEATSILLSKSAKTLFEKIPSFYCFVGNCNRFVGNPMPKFQLFPMVKPLPKNVLPINRVRFPLAEKYFSMNLYFIIKYLFNTL